MANVKVKSNTENTNKDITPDYVAGAKAVYKVLEKECKQQQEYINKIQHNKFDYDYDDKREDEQVLNAYVHMKICAEKTWRKFRHILEEQDTSKNKMQQLEIEIRKFLCIKYSIKNNELYSNIDKNTGMLSIMYKPNFAQSIAAEFVVYVYIDGRIELMGNFGAMIPTIRKFKSLEDFRQNV